MTTQPSDRIRLASWPTPLEPAPRLAGALGLGPDDLWIKRDDLTGLAGGGNKIRKLEWTVAAAIAAGADALVTTGAPQSNHARLTAAAGARLGLRVVLVFPGDPGGAQSGNLALDGLLGARIAWAADVGLAEAADAVVAQIRAQGGRPALIPFGGSSGVGARGYVACARELQQQLPDLDTVVVALGSGGTVAGFAAEAGEEPVDSGALRARFDQVGSGYGDLVESVAAAMSLIATTEGIVLDPIYTGRALAGLIAAIDDGDITSGSTTVLMHTGGLPGLFGHPVTLSYAQSLLQTFG